MRDTRISAQQYLKCCAEHPTCSPAAFALAVASGGRFVRSAGGWLPAVRAFRKVWKKEYSSNLSGIYSFDLDGQVNHDLLRYFRAMAEQGVPARQPGVNTRVPSQPHRSTAEHASEAFQKLWKDAHRGRILLCSTASDDLLRGVASSPWGRVEKLNPDRTLSGEGRFIHDQRVVNLTGSNCDHPLALQPRHATIARRILWWKGRHPASPS